MNMTQDVVQLVGNMLPTCSCSGVWVMETVCVLLVL